MERRARTRQQSRPMLFIDPQTEYITVAKLRLLTRRSLKEMRHPIIVTGDSRPAAIILNYQQYLDFQASWIKATEMAAQLSAGFDHMMAKVG